MGQRKQCVDGNRSEQDAILLPLKKEEGARSQGPRNVRIFDKLEKASIWMLP